MYNGFSVHTFHRLSAESKPSGAHARARALAYVRLPPDTVGTAPPGSSGRPHMTAGVLGKLVVIKHCEMLHQREGEHQVLWLRIQNANAQLRLTHPSAYLTDVALYFCVQRLAASLQVAMCVKDRAALRECWLISPLRCGIGATA